MKGCTALSAAVTVSLLLAAAGPRAASAADGPPPDGFGLMTSGSILILPLFDNSQQARTIVSITNTNSNRTICANGFRVGDVAVRYVYVSAADCQVFDRTELLSPSDTLAVRTDQHNPVFPDGWLWVEAEDPETSRPIDFDYLIGSAYLGHEKPNLKWWYGAYAFRSFRQEAGAPFGVDGCGHAFIDSNGLRADFNGLEYAFFPETVRIDHFLGEGQPPELGTASIDSRLYLMTTAPAGTKYVMSLYNNNERRFSRQFTFDCWLSSSLSDVAFEAKEANLRQNYDAGELGGLPYGQLDLTPEQGGVLGLFVERITRADGKLLQAFGRPLHFSGERTTSLERTP